MSEADIAEAAVADTGEGHLARRGNALNGDSLLIHEDDRRQVADNPLSLGERGSTVSFMPAIARPAAKAATRAVVPSRATCLFWPWPIRPRCGRRPLHARWRSGAPFTRTAGEATLRIDEIAATIARSASLPWTTNI